MNGVATMVGSRRTCAPIIRVCACSPLGPGQTPRRCGSITEP